MAKILLVEDDPMERRLYASLFEKVGYDVVTLSTGLHCRDEAIKQKPDVIVLDIMMPHMNGFETIDILHIDARTKHIPIIALTNLSDSHYKEEALKRGAVLFLTKSNRENSDLVAKVSDIVHSYSGSFAT